jgi:glycosyltransferase involved in cell wall biosynthesis
LGLKGTTFLYVGRLNAGKGLTDLFSAFGRLQAQSQSETSLLIVGDGPEEGPLRNQASVDQLQNVVFTGFQQKSTLPKFYAASDVFTFPTLGDPYGLVVDEAMACGLPVIATTSAGEIRDRIEDGLNGFLIPARDSTVLSERMRVFVQNPEAISRMGRESFARISHRTLEQWAVDFEGVVERILCGG